jgi:hypothetical protein
MYRQIIWLSPCLKSRKSTSTAKSYGYHRGLVTNKYVQSQIILADASVIFFLIVQGKNGQEPEP